MRINPKIFGVLVVVIFFGIIWGFQAAGVWSTSGKTDASGKKINPSADDVETIKGWMTLEQVVTTYDVSLEELLAAFSLPSDTPITTPIKDLESDTFSADALREWLLTGIVPQVIEETPLPEETPQPEATVDEISALETPLPTEHTPLDKIVNAKTSFQDLLDWGVPQEVIESILGSAMPDPAVLVKDYVVGTGLEFSTVKGQLQAEVDKTK